MPSSSRLLRFVGLATTIAHGRGVQAWSSLRIITSTWTPPRLKSPQGWSKGYSALFRTTATRLKVHRDYEADLVEQLVGGEKFEMNELPDSMMDTTVFVGNLCEFVQDNDLSQLFRSVSSLQSLPACVVRKPDTSSLRYGFVSFQTAAEKEVGWSSSRSKVASYAKPSHTFCTRLPSFDSTEPSSEVAHSRSRRSETCLVAAEYECRNE